MFGTENPDIGVLFLWGIGNKIHTGATTCVILALERSCYLGTEGELSIAYDLHNGILDPIKKLISVANRMEESKL